MKGPMKDATDAQMGFLSKIKKKAAPLFMLLVFFFGYGCYSCVTDVTYHIKYKSKVDTQIREYMRTNGHLKGEKDVKHEKDKEGPGQ